MLGSACFLLHLIGEDVLHDNVELVLIKNRGKLFYFLHARLFAGLEIEFAFRHFSEVL